MKYKTIIEIITEADNEHEAADIAGEFLRGDFGSAVVMNCHTRPFRSMGFLKLGLFFVLIAAFLGTAYFGYFKNSSGATFGGKNISACPPPLKMGQTTSLKQAWKDEENRKVLDYIKNK